MSNLDDPSNQNEVGTVVSTAQREETDWQSHPSVNSTDACPYCGAQAIHSQHCKRMCLCCGWFQSCVD